MKENLEKIDLLINENTDRQLLAVDWDQLYGRIQKQVDDAEKRTGTVSIKKKIFRWVVGISSAAAVLLVIFALMENRNPGLSLPSGQQAVVKLTEHRAVVKTEIEKRTGASHVSVAIEPPANRAQVRFGQQGHQVAQCDIVIIDQNGQTEKAQTPRPSWIIMMASKPASSENQTDKNQLEIACLL
jgi:preprotein translocase subunit SecF